ncbi:MAG: 50S ribosomal protein L21 [Firmicutes bacterium]|nr:50S ribosomal protein L21 [Bacillota bacterium]MBR6585461.1 50S ribosomal protein L21 [Bacillota bacterium]
MYAVIETGGKQYRVQEGDVITVEKLNVGAGETVAFDKVLVLGEGKDIKVGAPYTGDVVTGSVVENGKGQKVIIFKYKAKKDYRKKQGHRQPYTMVKIESLTGAAPKKEAPKAEAVEAVVEEAKPAKKVSASMKKDELIAFANENNIAIDEKATKAVIIEAIEAALK